MTMCLRDRIGLAALLPKPRAAPSSNALPRTAPTAGAAPAPAVAPPAPHSALEPFHRKLLAAAVRRFGARWIERLFPLYKPSASAHAAERKGLRRPAVVVEDEEAFEAVAEMLAEAVAEAAREQVVATCAPSAITLDQVRPPPLPPSFPAPPPPAPPTRPYAS